MQITRRHALIAGLSLFPALRATGHARAAAVANGEGRIRLKSGRHIGFAEYGSSSGVPVFYFHGTPGARTEAILIAEEAGDAEFVW